MIYYTSDAIHHMKKMRNTLEECKRLSSDSQSTTSLQQKIIELIDLMMEATEDSLAKNFDLNQNDLDRHL